MNVIHSVIGGADFRLALLGLGTAGCLVGVQLFVLLTGPLFRLARKREWHLLGTLSIALMASLAVGMGLGLFPWVLLGTYVALAMAGSLPLYRLCKAKVFAFDFRAPLSSMAAKRFRDVALRIGSYEVVLGRSLTNEAFSAMIRHTIDGKDVAKQFMVLRRELNLRLF